MPRARHEVCWRSLNIFLWKVLRWPTRKTPKVLFTLALNFSSKQGESSSFFLYLNTWVVSGKTRLESSGLITILSLVTRRMRKADQVPCCKKVKQFYLLLLCPMDKWSLTRLVRNYHPALMSGCEGRHLMTFVIFDCDCLVPCLPPGDDIMKWG